MPNLIYSGLVNSYDKKADGTKLVIGKGDRKGQPYYKLSFQVDGEYVNLMDFEGVTGGQKGEYRVEYYQKFLPNGEPDLYNDKPQYNLVDITPLGGQKAANPAVSQGQGTPTPNQGVRSEYDPNLSRRQTAANDATRIIGAIGGSMNADEMFSAWNAWAEHIDAWLIGQTIEQAVVEKLDAVEEDHENCPF